MNAELRQEFGPSREHFYAFLSGIFYAPVSKELHAVFANAEHAEMLAAMFSPETLEYFQEFRKSGPAPVLQQEFEDLFRVPGPWYTTPYESVFMDAREIAGKDVGGLLHGKSAHEVEKLYRRFGLQISPATPELPDYIGAELSFMSHLAGLGVNPESGFEPSALIETQKEFLEKHLGRWVPQYAQRLEEKAQRPYYKGVARLLAEFLQKDLEFLRSAGESSQVSSQEALFSVKKFRP